MIILIFLNQSPESVYEFNTDLLLNYKKIGDAYLSDMRRSMSKQPVDYELYYYLQQVYNAYYVIIGGLIDGTYEDNKIINKDYDEFVKQCDALLKNLDGHVAEHVIEAVAIKVNGVELLLKKLIYIISNYCDKSGGNL